MIPITFRNFHFHLNEFEQRLELGGGAQGRVFYDRLQNRDVAVKQIEDPEETFREANRHRYVKDCKFIVEILGVAFDGNDIPRGLVLELCHESTLHNDTF
ncbi:unnamed protein product, partial [Mesorhabditis belari]|uniref:Protein kinase domain-containing protein n=1 Tax=Mesorhabditis belari TaxID=2138241 RepID=A0AAF3ESJ4_9BILA